MQLSPQSIEMLCQHETAPLIEPFRQEYKHAAGLSGGLSCAGYDVHMGDMIQGLPVFERQPTRNDQGYWIIPPRTGVLAVTEERFQLPPDLAMHYYNKSSLARQFINACATLGEPGWKGHLTLEVYNQTDANYILMPGQPIGQVVFIRLDSASKQPYKGKYQGQEARPVQAR